MVPREWNQFVVIQTRLLYALLLCSHSLSIRRSARAKFERLLRRHPNLLDHYMTAMASEAPFEEQIVLYGCIIKYACEFESETIWKKQEVRHEMCETFHVMSSLNSIPYSIGIFTRSL